MNLPPMSERYYLLVESMRQAAHVVEIAFGISIGLLFSYWLIHWLLKPNTINATFRRLVYDFADLSIVAIFYYLIIIAQ